MVEVSLTVGKLDASLALLLTKDHHIIEFPTILLPDGISTGSIVKITCERDFKGEEKEKEQFEALQETIYETFGKHEPKEPVLKVVNVTQTSCVLEWDQLDLGTSELKSLTLYKNGAKLGQIRNATTKKNIKLSGLSIDTKYNFQLRMDTTSGIYRSNLLEIATHKMTDLGGITICLGDIDFSKETGFTLQDIEDAVSKVGARPIGKTVRIDTTHFVCTEPTGVECEKAKSINIPVVRPEWIKACELERRIVGVNKFYLNSENPIWKEKDFWKKSIPEASLDSASEIGNAQDNAEHETQSGKQENQDEPPAKHEVAIDEKNSTPQQAKSSITTEEGDNFDKASGESDPDAVKKVDIDKKSVGMIPIPSSEEKPIEKKPEKCTDTQQKTDRTEGKIVETEPKTARKENESVAQKEAVDEPDIQADVEPKSTTLDIQQRNSDVPYEKAKEADQQKDVKENDSTSHSALEKENDDGNIDEVGSKSAEKLNDVTDEPTVVDEKENEPLTEKKEQENKAASIKSDGNSSETSKPAKEEGQANIGLDAAKEDSNKVGGAVEKTTQASEPQSLDDTDADKALDSSTNDDTDEQPDDTDKKTKQQKKKKKKSRGKRGKGKGRK